MVWPFSRKRRDDMSVETLLADANQASPTAAAEYDLPPASGAGFQMLVEDVFSISGRGTVVTGQVAEGTVRVGQTVQLVRDGAALRTTTVSAIEMFRSRLEIATVGQNIGLLLSGVSRQDVQRGDLLTG